MRLDTGLLDDIKAQIHDRLDRVLRPAKEEYDTLTAMLSAMNGEERQEDPRLATLKQRARKRRQQKHHNGEQQRVAYLTSEQVDEMQKEARRKKVGLARYMEKHGYRNDGTGWRQD